MVTSPADARRICVFCVFAFIACVMSGCASPPEPRLIVTEGNFSAELFTGPHRGRVRLGSAFLYLPEGDWELMAKKEQKAVLGTGIGSGEMELFAVVFGRIATNEFGDKEVAGLLLAFSLEENEAFRQQIRATDNVEGIGKRCTEKMVPLKVGGGVTGCLSLVEIDLRRGSYGLAFLGNDLFPSVEGRPTAPLKQQLKDFLTTHGIEVPTEMKGVAFVGATHNTTLTPMYLFNPNLPGYPGKRPSERPGPHNENSALMDWARSVEPQFVAGLLDKGPGSSSFPGR